MLWTDPQMGAPWAAEQTSQRSGQQFPQNHWWEGKNHDRGDKSGLGGADWRERNVMLKGERETEELQRRHSN